jgi:hypothetical protein
MGDQLLPLPLSKRSVHPCVDVQRIFSAEGPWPTPWMDRALPVAAGIANRHPERTVFTRFIPPERPDQMPDMWRRYYRRWQVATRECLDPRLLELMQLLAAPPAPVIDKTRYFTAAEDKTALYIRWRGLRRFAPMALDAAAGFLAGGSAAMLRLKASIRLTTFSREGAIGSAGAGSFARFFLRIRTSAFL